MNTLIAALDRFRDEADHAIALGDRLGQLLLRGATCLAAGNGGSAAQAEHLVAELVGRYRSELAPLAAIALTASSPTVTALLNDYGANDVFARQVCAHGRDGDVLVLLSTSGRSANVVAAASAAVDAGLHVWSLTGPVPNALADLSHENVTVPDNEVATIQEVHQVVVHLLAQGVDESIAAASAPQS